MIGESPPPSFINNCLSCLQLATFKFLKLMPFNFDSRGTPVVHCEIAMASTAKIQKDSPNCEEIVTAFVPFKRSGQRVRPTILFSHGNAVDLGQMLPFYRFACIQLIYRPFIAKINLYVQPSHIQYHPLICFYRYLSRNLQCNVMGYDYTGYGCSTGMALLRPHCS